MIQIRPVWTKRVSNRLARGEGVREDFSLQAGIFYNLLQQAVETGDPTWLDRLLTDWAEAQPEAQSQASADPPFGDTGGQEVESESDDDLQIRESSLPPILNALLLTTVEVSREGLNETEALELIETVLPVFTHAFEFVTNKESKLHVDQVSRDLKKAQGVLEELDKTKSDFISIAAHELKTPLTLIEGYVAMLEESLHPGRGGDDQSSLLIEGIHQGTHRLHEIIDDMIDVSMIDSHLLSLAYQPVWIHRLFTLIQEELSDILRERSQTLIVKKFPGTDTPIYGDSERLYQAFRNIVLNAVKFTPDGGKITVDGRRLPGFLEITIADTGIGIEPKDHNRIFEKFGRVGNVSLHSSGKTKFKGGGPGLGLPISKGIVDAHGGAIWVESEGYDEIRCPGTTMHILLPVDNQPPERQISRLFSKKNESESYTASFTRDSTG